jgi:hypothetical protein
MNYHEYMTSQNKPRNRYRHVWESSGKTEAVWLTIGLLTVAGVVGLVVWAGLKAFDAGMVMVP